MTAQVLFDTARFRDRLTTSGMPEVQARAVTESFEEALRGATATKVDVERQGERLSGEIQRLDVKIDGVEERLNARISVLDESIGRRIAEAQASQSRWIIASMFGGLSLLFAALKLFP